MYLGTRLLCDFRRLEHMQYSYLDLYRISPSIWHFDFRLFIEKIAGIQSVLDLRGFGVCMTYAVLLVVYRTISQSGVWLSLGRPVALRVVTTED